MNKHQNDISKQIYDQEPHERPLTKHIKWIIEAAGGASCVCSSDFQVHLEPLSLLDVLVSELDKRVGV